MQNYEYLGKPLQIGRLAIRNRFCMAPIGGGQHHLPGGGLKDETIQYLIERAKGGFGLIFTGAIAADGTVDPYTGVGPTILQNPDAFKMTATELNERAGAYGTKIFAQITMGLGRNYPSLPAPSSVHVFRHPGEVSPELTCDQIKSKIESVVKASKIAKDSGFSGVEVHSIHWGYLLDQFALSMMNHRTDEYGGSLENRLRAAKEILEGIKQECGSDFPVSIYKYSCYRCRQGVNLHRCPNRKIVMESTLEAMMLDRIRPELEKYIAEYEVANLPALRTDAKRRNIEGKLQKLKDLYLNDLITMDEFKLDREKLLVQLEKINAEDSRPVKDLTYLRDFLKMDFESLYDSFSIPEKRELWRSIVKEIRVDHEKNIRIIFL